MKLTRLVPFIVEMARCGRRASSPSVLMMMDMVEEDSSRDVHKKQDVEEKIPEYKADLLIPAPWKRQTTPNFSRQTTPNFSPQTTPFSSEVTPKNIPRRRPSSPSMHMMHDMADETDAIEVEVTKEPSRNLEEAIIEESSKPRRRASSPSIGMMQDMLEEA